MGLLEGKHVVMACMPYLQGFPAKSLPAIFYKNRSKYGEYRLF